MTIQAIVTPPPREEPTVAITMTLTEATILCRHLYHTAGPGQTAYKVYQAILQLLPNGI